MNLPSWAEEYVRLRRDRRGLPTEWEQNDPGRFSRVVHIAYPNGVYFVVDRLTDNGWLEQEGTHYVEATAVSTAQKKAYFTQTPHRVRQVVWSG